MHRLALVDPGVGVPGHLEFFEHLRDDLGPVFLGGVGRQPQFGRVHQRLVDGQLAVHHVVLRHHPDPGAQRGVLGVNVVALERNRARRRMGVAGHLPRERRLARTRWPDDRRQVPGRAEIEMLSSSVLLPSMVRVISEACGLRVDDVDFTRGVVHPHQQYGEAPLKTAGSEAPIPILAS